MATSPPATVELRCPTHGEPLAARDGSLVCPRDGEQFPIVQDIPILIADRGERDRVVGTDWSKSAAPAPLDFYNKVQGQAEYLLSELNEARAGIQTWLPSTQAQGPVLEIGSGKGVLQGIGDDYVAID